MLKHIIKKYLFLIPATMLVAVALVAILAWKGLRTLNKKNGFTRTFITSQLQLKNVIIKPSDVIDFAGSTSHHLYFRTTNPRRLYKTDINLQKRGYTNLNIPTNGKINSMYACIVDSPNVYVAAGNARLIIKSTFNDSSATIHKVPDGIFTRVALISENTFALRIFEKIDQIFGKKNLLTGKLIKEINISEKNRDAGISSDGELHYDKTSNLLVYTQYYRNEYYVLDTNLNLIRRSKINGLRPNISFEAGKVSSKKAITNLTPKRIINGASCAYDGYLFNNSKLISDNESREKFENSFVIDIYDINNGLEKGSFYIPSLKKEKARKFKYLNNEVFVVYKNYIATYSLPLKLKTN